LSFYFSWYVSYFCFENLVIWFVRLIWLMNIVL
jgi:hypothetical protein